jgi:hypothetical protein
MITRSERRFNKMKSKLLTIVAGALALGSSVFSPLQARADASVDLGYLAAKEKSASYLESNYSTALPLGARLSGFMDLMENDAGYFGKAAVSRSLTKDLSARTQIVSVNSPVSEAGFGLQASIPNLPKRLYVNLNVMPLWVNSDGVENLECAKVGYFASLSLPKDFYAWSCGEIKPFNKGGTWSYGELEVGKKIGKNLSAGINFAMDSKGEGELIPEFNPRLALRYQF